MIEIPVRTAPGQNVREHYMVRARRVKREREATAWMLKSQASPMLPCKVTITRVAPSRGLDSDNLQGALKAIRDEIACWLGVDDGKSDTVRYDYAQARGEWGVVVEFGEY